MEIQGKKVLVIGMGKSGISAAKLLMAKQAEVLVADSAPAEKIQKRIDFLHDLGIKTYNGDFSGLKVEEYNLIVTCPGVPRDIPLFMEADKKAIPVIGELELAARYIKKPLVAITGTNGKTTVTAMLGHIFQEAGLKTIVAGNIGSPLADFVEISEGMDIGVVEVSSYQLETVEEFHPRVALLTNLTPDHMERHKTMEKYLDIKARIFARQNKEDLTILNKDDQYISSLADKAPGKVMFFSKDEEVMGAFIKDKSFVFKGSDRGEIIRISEIRDFRLPGEHNLENALACICAASYMGLDKEDIKKGLNSFPGVEHRLEFVRELDGITYINDSKATNPESAIKALESFGSNVIAIYGGSPKKTTYDALAVKTREKGIKVVLVGETKEEIRSSLDKIGYTDYVEAKDFEDAVATARKLAVSGDIVLLSPACASFDYFENFEVRGKVFKEIVHGYKGAEKK